MTVVATDAMAIAGHDSEDLASGLFSFARSSGNAGRTIVVTPTLTVDGGLIATPTPGAGRAGDIVIQAGRVTLTGGAIIDSSSLERGTGAGGAVTITATESVVISGRDRGGVPSGLSSFAGRGDGGQVRIITPTLSMDAGRIAARTVGEGRAGDIVIEVGRLILTGGATIDSFTGGAGAAGTVMVTATDSIAISGRLGDIRSGLHSFTSGSGDAGHLIVVTPTLSMDGSAISTTSGLGMGRAGDIVIQAGG